MAFSHDILYKTLQRPRGKSRADDFEHIRGEFPCDTARVGPILTYEGGRVAGHSILME